MRVCQIGLGRWGKNHSRVWNELRKEGKIDEIMFYDINQELTKKIAKRYDGIQVSDLKNLDVDLVDIVVQASSHHKLAKPFIERGIKVFIEKPFTDSVEDALELTNLSEDPERQIMVGHIFRYHEGVSFAKNLIKRSAIGDLRKIDIRRLSFGNPRTDNGVIFSLAIHDLDLFCYFNNEDNPNSVSAIASKIKGPTEDHAFIKLQFDKNIGIAEESWMSPSTGKVRTCSIQGTEGEITFDFSKPSLVHVNSKYLNHDDDLVDYGKFTHHVEFKEPLKVELEDFVIKSKNKEKYLTGPNIGIRALKLCQLAMDSYKQGHTLNFTE